MRLAILFAACLLAAPAQPPLGSLSDLDAGGIRYRDRNTGDPVARVAEKVRTGAVTLQYDPDFGYLPSLLRELNVPVSSQGLVFSKTSLQIYKIFPRNPRAIYFNDDVYVGYVPGGDVIEVSAVDPLRGGIFYAIDQEPVARPKFERRDDCLQCHVSSRTFNVPGHLMRSVWPAASGHPLIAGGGYATDHRSPMRERWGGWYVTGKHPNDVHLGNQTIPEDGKPEDLDPSKGANVTDLVGRFNDLRYLSPHSDIVALMVLGHQIAMHNLIARAGFEARLALEQQESMARALKTDPEEFSDSTRRRIERPAEELVRYLLFREEAPLKGRVTGTSSFAQDFVQGGRKDGKGRSLRELDLTTRLFKYPVSWLVDSEAFDALPLVTRRYVYGRVKEILGRADAPLEDRAALEILLALKPEASSL